MSDARPIPERRAPNWRLRRFGLSAVFWLTILAAALFAWRRDHQLQQAKIQRLRGELLVYQKQGANWGVEQLIGPPDTPGSGDLSTAWASETTDKQPEWIELEYADAVEAVEIEVHETFNPGALTKVSVFDYWGREQAVWQGTDPTSPLALRGKSKIPVAGGWNTRRIKLYLDSPNVPGWNEIDAVGLRDASGRVQWAEAATASSAYGGRLSRRNRMPLVNIGP